MERDGDERTYVIIGAAMEAHRILGPWYLEAVYQEALEIELRLRGTAFVAKPRLTVPYKGQTLRSYYIPDFLVGEVVVEIKAHSALSAIDVAQTLNSMECAKVHIGLPVNFGEPSLKWKRLIL
jgi:GxxExxY protein